MAIIHHYPILVVTQRKAHAHSTTARGRRRVSVCTAHMAAASPGDSSHHLLASHGVDAALSPSGPDVSGGEAHVDTAPPPMWTRDCALPLTPH